MIIKTGLFKASATKKGFKTDIGTLTKTVVKQVLNDLKKKTRTRIPRYCDVCRNWTCMFYSYVVSKRSDGSIRVGCTVIDKENVSLIRKWAYSK